VAAIYNDSNDDRKLRQLEINFGINKDTIQRYAKDPDRKDRIQAAVEKLLLTEDEEVVLANEIELSSRRACPLTIAKIKKRVNSILKMKQESAYQVCGEN
jgi:hypothetical protein